MTTRATRSQRRRTVVALAVVLIVLAAFVIRLVDIQVVNANQHISDSRDLATETARVVYGARGEITDTHGAVLATSTTLYDVQVDPMMAAKGIAATDADGKKILDDEGQPVTIEWTELAAAIAEITGQDAAKVAAVVTDAVAADPADRFEYITRYASTATYRELAELELPFLTFPPHPARTYPDGAVAGNIVGFVGSDGTPLEGIESVEESCLAAEDGRVLYQRGADGVIIPGTEETEKATDGGTLRLTIDADLQWYMQQLIAEETDRLRANWGGIVVVEVATGKIRAAAETASVDPNDVGASAPEDRASRLLRYSYEPGSTFKPVTAATAIEQAGLTSASTVVVPDRKVFANGAVINDSEHHATETLTLAGGLVRSSNVAMSQFGALVDPETRLEYLQKFGVGEGTALNWPGEPQGTYIPVDQWDNQTYYTTTFGQAFTVTVPQVASVYQTIANDGVRMPLSLVESCTSADGVVHAPDLPAPTRVIDKSTAAEVGLMLENVFAQGTLADDVAIDGYRMAGKTGTAQVPNGKGGYKSGVYFTSLVGYAPADDPQYVVLTVFDEPKKTRMSSANRPAFTQAMTQVLKHYRIMPSESETSLLPVTR
ncbi:peptidoglycan D,D-transpeptidase FtsI family protein [Microbacterium sp.]|uniref:peptidoglycan D,D-transpeptidase FtsI family protein n=1 Tax=Microbacterium sp. TaxID=51671 RepID=UPI003A842CCA